MFRLLPSTLQVSLVERTVNPATLELIAPESRFEAALKLYQSIPNHTIRVLIDHHWLDVLRLLWERVKFGLNRELIIATLTSGHPAIVRWVQSLGYPLNSVYHGPLYHIMLDPALNQAAASGNVELVNYLHNQGYRGTEATVEAAAAGGHQAVVEQLHELGYRANEQSLVMAVRGGHLELVRWLMARLDARAIDSVSYYDIVESGNPAILRIILPYVTNSSTEKLCRLAYARWGPGPKYLEVLEGFVDRATAEDCIRGLTEYDRWELAGSAIRYENLPAFEELNRNPQEEIHHFLRDAIDPVRPVALRYLLSRATTIPSNIFRQLVELGDYQLLQQAYQVIDQGADGVNYYDKCEYVMHYRAYKDGFTNVARLGLAREGGFFPPAAYITVGMSGSVTLMAELLRLDRQAHTRSELETRPWAAEETLYYAAGNGHLALVKYLVDELHLTTVNDASGVPDRDPVVAAVQNGHWPVMEYLQQHGWSLTPTLMRVAIESGSTRTVETLLRLTGWKLLAGHAKSTLHFEMVRYLTTMFRDSLEFRVDRLIHINDTSSITYLLDRQPEQFDDLTHLIAMAERTNYSVLVELFHRCDVQITEKDHHETEPQRSIEVHDDDDDDDDDDDLSDYSSGEGFHCSICCSGCSRCDRDG